MRSMVKIDGKWVTEQPGNLSAWLWKNDGLDAVAIDDSTKTYYCGTEELQDKFQDAWAKERKNHDLRTAKMFADLDYQLFESEE